LNDFDVVTTKPIYLRAVKNYIVLFREPDGRVLPHPQEEIARKAGSLDEAASIKCSCPIYEFGGYAEVREMQD
jgi:hypothetical protein